MLNRPRPVVVLGLALLVAGGCSVSHDGTSPGPSNTIAAASQSAEAALTGFTITTAAGDENQIGAVGDCTALSDPWLQAWCRDLVTYRPGVLPTKLEPNQKIDRATIQLIYAGLAWAVLRGDGSICDNPLVAAFVSSSPGGAPGPSPTPSMSPTQRCRQGIATSRAEAEGHGGSFSVLSPDTLVEVRVGLPGGEPLPTPRPS